MTCPSPVAHRLASIIASLRAAGRRVIEQVAGGPGVLLA